MASLRTEITEIVTGLGMLGLSSVDEALATRPEAVVGVEHRHYDKLIAARADGKYGVQFEEAWANGVAFAAAEDGLRGRQPKRVEWKGPHQAPSYEGHVHSDGHKFSRSRLGPHIGERSKQRKCHW